MIPKAINLPFYAKSSILLVGLIAFVAILYIARVIIVPIVFSVIIAILLNPVVNFFTRKWIPRIIAITITLLLTFIIIAIVGVFLVSQISQFGDSWPIIVEKFTAVINNTISWFSEYFNINVEKINEWILQTKGEIVDGSSNAIGKTLLSLGSGLIVLFLIPVYVFMILFYKPLILEFVHKLFGSDKRTQVSEIVNQVKIVIQKYLTGLIIEVIIIAVMDIAALLILGIQYAVLIGIIGALLNLIPYVGGLVAVGLPMMIALATETSPWSALYVLILYYAIQLIDNNLIVPVIVSSKVKINALFSVIVVIVGNALWGISGMFLSIPLLAIVKLLFDHIESLKPWGYLLGDTMPTKSKIKPILEIIKKKMK